MMFPAKATTRTFVSLVITCGERGISRWEESEGCKEEGGGGRGGGRRRRRRRGKEEEVEDEKQEGGRGEEEQGFIERGGDREVPPPPEILDIENNNWIKLQLYSTILSFKNILKSMCCNSGPSIAIFISRPKLASLILFLNLVFIIFM